MKPIRYQSRITAIHDSAEDTKTFHFEKPKDFSYTAGQYMRLMLTESKYFTFSSAPYEHDLQITVKIRSSQFRDQLYALKVGDSFDYYAPIGIFCLEGKSLGKYIMLAGGVGMTPFYSMLKEFSHQRAFVDVRYLASYQTANHVLFQEELLAIAHKSKGHIKVWHTLTRMFPPEGNKHIFDFKEMLLKEAEHMEGVLWMIAGGDEMVQATKEFLILKLGVAPDTIFVEKFI